MRTIQNLDARSWPGSAGDVEWSLQTLRTTINGRPSAIAEIALRCHIRITTGAGGGCTGSDILGWFSNLRLTDRLGHSFIDGITLNEYGALCPFAGQMPPEIPVDIAASQTNVNRYFTIRLRAVPSTYPDAETYSWPAGLLNGGALRVRLGGSALNANSTVTLATIEPVVIYYVPINLRIPPRTEVRASTFSPYASLPSGVYPGLALSLAGSPTLNSITISAGQRTWIESMTPTQIYTAAVGDLYAMFSTMSVLSSSSFLAIFPGLTDYVTAAGMPALPLIWSTAQVQQAKVTQNVDTGADTPLMVEIDGPTSIRLIYWRIEHLRKNDVARTLQGLGASPDSVVVTKEDDLGRNLSPETSVQIPGLASVPAKVSVVLDPVRAGLLRR